MTTTNGNGNGNGHGTGRYTMRYLAGQFLDLFENHWCSGPPAMDAQGNDVELDGPRAVRWCSDGAMERAKYIAVLKGDRELEEALNRFHYAWGAEAEMQGWAEGWSGIIAANEVGGLPSVRKILKAVAAK